MSNIKRADSDTDTMGKTRGKARMTELAAQGHIPSPSMQTVHAPMTEARKAKFLDYLSHCGSIAEASQSTDGVNSARAYRRLMQNDPAFREAADSALETFGSKILGVLRDQILNPQTQYVTGAGQVILHPKTGEPLTKTTIDAKLLLAYARRFDAQLRDVKTQVNIDGSPSHDPIHDPRIVIQSSDMMKLDPAQVQTLLAIARVIYQNRQTELGFELKDITPSNSLIEDAEYSEDAQPIQYDPWEEEYQHDR